MHRTANVFSAKERYIDNRDPKVSNYTLSIDNLLQTGQGSSMGEDDCCEYLAQAAHIRVDTWQQMKNRASGESSLFLFMRSTSYSLGPQDCQCQKVMMLYMCATFCSVSPVSKSPVFVVTQCRAYHELLSYSDIVSSEYP